MVKALRILFLFAIVCANVPLLAQSTMDSLLRILPSQSGEARIHTLSEVVWELSFNDLERAAAYGTEEMKLAAMTHDSAMVAIASNDNAVVEYRLGHLQRSVDLNKRALRIREQLRDTLGIAASHNKLGVAYSDMVILDSAMLHNYAAERIYIQRGDKVHAAQMRGNNSRIYDQLGDKDQALKAARESVEMLNGVDEDYPRANAYGQLCMMLEDRKLLDEALVAGEQAVDLFEHVGAKAELANMSSLLGMIQRDKGNDEEGLRYYRKALALGEDAGDMTGVATYATNVANVLVARDQLLEAIPLYERSITISAKEGYAEQRINALKGYVTALEKAGRTKDALNAQKELFALNDNVYKKERMNVLNGLQVKYETERTEKELAQAREREVQQHAEIARRRVMQGVLIGAIMGLALLAFLLISRQRARHKARLTAEVVAERERGLKAVLANTDAERNRIAGELHDGVGQQLTGLKFRLEDIASRVSEKLPDEASRVQEVLTIADEASRDVRTIAHQMMPRALGDLGLAPALNDMLHKSFGRPGMHHTFEQFGLDARLRHDVEVGVYRIAQELVGNIMKHADARNVNVQLLKNKGHLVLIVEDDGRGIDPARRSNGIGMLNIADRARVLHGTIEFDNAQGGGTVATLRVPLINGHTTT